jgi:hypothetical protein
MFMTLFVLCLLNECCTGGGFLSGEAVNNMS